MSCASCQAHVTKAVSSLPGVKSAAVSLLAKNMVVDYDEKLVDESAIIKAVESAGYGACPFVNQSLKEIQKKRQLELAKKRKSLWLSGIFLVLLMVVSMGGMIAKNQGWPNESDSNYSLITFLEVTLKLFRQPDSLDQPPLFRERL